MGFTWSPSPLICGSPDRRLQSKNQDIYAREQELIKERELHEAKALRLQQQADRAQRSLKHNKASRELEDQLQVTLRLILNSCVHGAHVSNACVGGWQDGPD